MKGRRSASCGIDRQGFLSHVKKSQPWRTANELTQAGASVSAQLVSAIRNTGMNPLVTVITGNLLIKFMTTSNRNDNNG